LFVNMLNIIRAGGQISLGGDFNTVTVVITMSDGSKITLFYNGDWQLTSTMARSAEGRVIMTEDNIRGFTEDPLPMVNDQSMEAFLNNARRFGIRVNSSTGWSGGSRAVVCTSYTDENGEEQTVCAGSGG
jgi:hypothetical protein